MVHARRDPSCADKGCLNFARRQLARSVDQRPDVTAASTDPNEVANAPSVAHARVPAASTRARRSFATRPCPGASYAACSNDAPRHAVLGRVHEPSRPTRAIVRCQHSARGTRELGDLPRRRAPRVQVVPRRACGWPRARCPRRVARAPRARDRGLPPSRTAGEGAMSSANSCGSLPSLLPLAPYFRNVSDHIVRLLGRGARRSARHRAQVTRAHQRGTESAYP